MPSSAAANGTGEMAVRGRIGRDEVQERRTGPAPRPVSGFRWAAPWRLAISRPHDKRRRRHAIAISIKERVHKRRIQGSLMSLSGGRRPARGRRAVSLSRHTTFFLVLPISAPPPTRPGTEARWGLEGGCVEVGCSPAASGGWFPRIRLGGSLFERLRRQREFHDWKKGTRQR
jgi:hypothetical protein